MQRASEWDRVAKVQLAAWSAYGALLTVFAVRAVRDGQPGSAVFIAALVPVFTHALLQVPGVRRRRRRVRQWVGGLLAAWVALTAWVQSIDQTMSALLLVSTLGPALALYLVDRVDEQEVERQRTLDSLESESRHKELLEAVKNARPRPRSVAGSRRR